MSFLSLSYGLFLVTGIIVYYCIPKKGQWIWLLLLGMLFYLVSSPVGSLFLLFSIVSSYLYAVSCRKSYEIAAQRGREALLSQQKKQRFWLFATIFVNVELFLFFKIVLKLPLSGGTFFERFRHMVPLGISFYTLQIIAYMVDVYKGRAMPEKNLFRYTLFVTFFPQILLGPIPRFGQLHEQLFEEHSFDYTEFVSALMLIEWGFFQKLVVADNAAVVVNRVFGEYQTYGGLYVILAVFFYSMELYADFSGCVCIARGSARLFGIRLSDNFAHPYFSCSVKEFWGRWHISLSSFLKDYVYIPLGGNRKGKLRKYVNLLLVFLVSGIWHGAGMTYLVWGFLHGFYQILEEAGKPYADKVVAKLGIDTETFSFRLFRQIRTFVLVAFAWLFFRSDSVRMALYMGKSMVTDFHLYALFDESFYLLGLNGREFRVLCLSICVMWLVSFLQERMNLKEVFLRQNLVFRWTILLLGIFAVLIFGMYGPGYDAAQFIYGNF